ncbi:hypothetical protein KW803_01975 [Candidatus Saccharibacteria bacterium]|nr:hypothetical protein [Candidatus Saccharibacteria bacterium]
MFTTRELFHFDGGIVSSGQSIAIADNKTLKTFDGLVRLTIDFFRENDSLTGTPLLSIGSAARAIYVGEVIDPTQHRDIERSSLVAMEMRLEQSVIFGMSIFDRIADEAKFRMGSEYEELFDGRNSAYRLQHSQYEL